MLTEGVTSTILRANSDTALESIVAMVALSKPTHGDVLWLEPSVSATRGADAPSAS